MNPLVSCCLITYNHSNYINQAIESILMQQTDFDFEVIIADDCSKDDTPQKIKHYADKFPGKIRLIKREKNVGPAQNFMELLAAATCKYVAYLEGDDYWTDKLKLQQQVDFLEKHADHAISSHNTTVQDKNNNRYLFSSTDNHKELHNSYTLEDYLQIHFFHSSSIMYRRNKLMPFPAWYPNAFSGDGFLVLLLAMEGKIHYINRPMSLYRHNSNSISNYSSLVEINKNFEKHFRLFDAHSGYKYSKAINRKIFTLAFNLNYYNTSYLKKLYFFTQHFFRIIRANKKSLPAWRRFKFLLPAQILKSRVNIQEKK